MSASRLKRQELLLFLIPILSGVLLLAIRSVHFVSPRENALRSSCMARIRAVGQELALYTRDFNGYYPPVIMNGGRRGQGRQNPYKPAGVGWVDAMTAHSPIAVSTFLCYGDKFWTVNGNMLPALPGYTNYWLNCNLSHLKRVTVASPATTLMLGEGGYHDQSDATYCKAALPQSWLTDENSPAFRHAGGANYLTVDGAGHWLKPEVVTNFAGRKSAFALRD